MDNAEIERRLEEAGTYKPTKGNWWKRWHPRYERLCPLDDKCFGYHQWFKIDWRPITSEDLQLLAGDYLESGEES